MSIWQKNRASNAAVLVSVCLTVSGALWAGESPTPHLLAGTWTLHRAGMIRPDGTEVTDPAYGPDAQGLLIIDGEGRYSLQIFRPDRPKFASGEKIKGTPEEYKAAVLGISTHVGRIVVDSVNNKLVFQIEHAVYPNWEHTEQRRDYRLSGDELTYKVPPMPGGTSAVSIYGDACRESTNSRFEEKQNRYAGARETKRQSTTAGQRHRQPRC